MQRLLARYPFHANVVAAGIVVAEPVKTMAVTVRDGVLTFLYSPAFVEATELEVLVGALLHEVGHVLADHLLANAADYPDRRARTIAEEVSVNETVGEPLPAGVLRIEQFDLPPDEDTDARYERLAARTEKAPDVPKKRRSGRKGASDTKKRESARGSSEDVETFDDHTVWNEATQTPQETRDVIDRAVLSAADRLTSADKVALPRAVQQRVLDARRRINGGPTSAERIVSGVARIPWERILEPFGARRRDAAATFRRPSRRFSALAGIVPSYIYRASKLRLVGVIDTSGSMQSATLAVISAELQALARLHDVTVVQCDDTIRSVAPYSGPISEIIGRGGTDFRPPLEAEFLSALRVDVVVYFCDGDGPAPVSAPRPPVIWAITSGGLRPASWGDVVWLLASGFPAM
ncbi:MAG TPA: VWA-like domain-containing protein [Thermoanaerobaculia bacterium]